MKEYKGLYHNTKDTTKTYEYGAHFKYSDLFNILKDLEEKQKENNKQETKQKVGREVEPNYTAHGEYCKKKHKHCCCDDH